MILQQVEVNCKVMILILFLFQIQAPFNTITYSIIGDERAPTLFSINQVSGVITTSSTSLFSDPNTLYTVSTRLYSVLVNLYIDSH